MSTSVSLLALVLTMAALSTAAFAAPPVLIINTYIVYPKGFVPSPNVVLTKTYVCQEGLPPEPFGYPFKKPVGYGSATSLPENYTFVAIKLNPGVESLNDNAHYYACRGTISANGTDVTLPNAPPYPGFSGDSPSNTLNHEVNNLVLSTITIDPEKYAAVVGRTVSPSPGVRGMYFTVTPSSVSQRTKCPAFTAVQHNGTAAMQYRYVRSDGARGKIYTSAVSAGTVPVQGTTWTLGDTYNGWIAIESRPMPATSGGAQMPWNITSNKAAFSITCP